MLTNTHTHTHMHAHIHTHTHNRYTALWILSGTTRVRRYQKKHSLTHTYSGHQLSLICFFHLLRSMASSLLKEVCRGSTCFAVVPRLCHQILVSLSTLYLELSCSFTRNIHLTILISPCWRATSFSFLMCEVSLPCNMLLCTHPLYNLPLTFNDISLLVSSGTNCLNLFH